MDFFIEIGANTNRKSWKIEKKKLPTNLLFNYLLQIAIRNRFIVVNIIYDCILIYTSLGWTFRDFIATVTQVLAAETSEIQRMYQQVSHT